MAKLMNMLFSVAAGMLVLSVIVKAAASAEAAETTVKFDLPPEPHPGFYQDLSKCLTKITETCGAEIYRSIYQDHGKISKGCCDELVDMGLLCHRTILLTSVQLLDKDEKAKTDVDKVYNKSYLIWSKCVDASMPADDEESPAPSPAFVF